MRAFLILPLIALLLTATPMRAQQQQQVQPNLDAVTFPDYDSFTAFLDEKVMQRQFGVLMQKMSGGSLSLAQVQQLTEQMRQGFTTDFDHVAVMRQAELEDGFRQELRVYWAGNIYAYVVMLVHQRENDIAVLNLGIHVAPVQALAMF
ncbi:MAG: hypothetical protein ACK5JR_08055 [Tropicimonas sp.]|uniref:hypothetical protein n=1 Tax=Tropicimonas sp. TaxID=2067044 RepID=UPI003A8796F3